MLVRKVFLRSKWMVNDLFGKLRVPLNLEKTHGQIRVICFHGVCSDDRPFINGRFMRVSQFENLLKALVEKTNILNLDDYLNKKVDPNRLNILLTFDDGYRNIRVLALPILQKLNAPSTIFCTSREVLWMDLLDIIAAEKSSLDKVYESFPVLRNATIQEIKSWGVRQSAVVLLEFTSLLRQMLGSAADNYHEFFELLTDQDLLELHTHPLISIANHGARHISYTHRTIEEVKEDIEECKKRLILVKASHPNVFAYPFGHFRKDIQDGLSETGYPTQFVTEGNPKLSGDLRDRLVVNPFISVRNQLICLRNGKY